MGRRSTRINRFVATTSNNSNHVEREMQIETSNPHYAASVAFIQKKRLEAERKRSKPIPVQVQILTGRKIHLLVDRRRDTTFDIKKKIQAKEGIHPDQQILLLNGVRLHEFSNIRHLRLEENALFFLTLRNRGG